MKDNHLSYFTISRAPNSFFFLTRLFIFSLLNLMSVLYVLYISPLQCLNAFFHSIGYHLFHLYFLLQCRVVWCHSICLILFFFSLQFGNESLKIQTCMMTHFACHVFFHCVFFFFFAHRAKTIFLLLSGVNAHDFISVTA